MGGSGSPEKGEGNSVYNILGSWGKTTFLGGMRDLTVNARTGSLPGGCTGGYKTLGKELGREITKIPYKKRGINQKSVETDSEAKDLIKIHLGKVKKLDFETSKLIKQRVFHTVIRSLKEKKYCCGLSVRRQRPFSVKLRMTSSGRHS